jgi:hypothetical protein
MSILHTIIIGTKRVTLKISIDGNRFSVTDPNRDGILYGGYVYNGEYGIDVLTQDVFYFRDWLDKKIKTELRKLKINVL